MKKDLYYNAQTDQWTCVVDKLMDVEECEKVQKSVIAQLRIKMFAESDAGKNEVTRRSIAALVEGRVIQTVGAKTPALIGR